MEDAIKQQQYRIPRNVHCHPKYHLNIWGTRKISYLPCVLKNLYFTYENVYTIRPSIHMLSNL